MTRDDNVNLCFSNEHTPTTTAFFLFTYLTNIFSVIIVFILRIIILTYNKILNIIYNIGEFDNMVLT